ncbi:hypothetical protein L5515_000619 [Caenorhabditis briggsae]|uniref:Uncharacterized protein n=1 Tax=Caenorhabditis briggsae TaxID=6238 RepID=A0AAE9E0J3_CAEBR|nr:hypothetical protein L5515_000619 [Caenorhabditis briggsae]
MDVTRPLPKFQKHNVSNLLDREIGSENQKYKSVQNSFHHHSQLFASSSQLTNLQLIDFNKCDPSISDTQFDSDADCLGFSPDGKYLAFHSHAHSAISVLKYTGIENMKGAKDQSDPLNCFGGFTKFELAPITREHRYQNEKIIRSWWTDDSSTLIIQLTIEQFREEEQAHDEPDEEILVVANDIMTTESYQNAADVPDPVAWFDEIVGSDFYRPGQEQYGRSTISRRTQNFHDRFMFLNQFTTLNDVREYHHQESSGRYYENEFTCEDPPKAIQHRETSRTMPYYSAVKAAAQVAIDEQRFHRECSRTMSVFHAVTSSAHHESEAYLDEDDTFASTSKSARRLRSPNSSQEGGTKQKRAKTDSFVSTAIEEAWNSMDDYEKWNSENYPRSVRHVVHLLQKFPEYAADFKTSGPNINCLGYSRPGSDTRRASTVRQKPFSDRFREMRSFIAGLDQSDPVDKNEKPEATVVFVAFHVETKKMIKLPFEKVFTPYHCHGRDRLVVFSCNNDFIQVYHLSDVDHEWISQKHFRLSQLDSEPLQLKYRTGTMPGMPSLNRDVQTGSVIGDLFDIRAFNSPIQQDVATLLGSNMPEYFNSFKPFLTETPTISSIRCLSDGLIAVSMSYSRLARIQMGVSVSLVDSTVEVYADYHKFLKLLFTHHLPDLLPRHWTHNNPYPVTEQSWFKNEIIDVSNPKEMTNFKPLNDIYQFFDKIWHNVRSVSNPLQCSLFNKTHAYQLLFNYLFNDGRNITFREYDDNLCRAIRMEQYYHPSDPFKLIKNVYQWYLAFQPKDPDNVIVHSNRFKA